MVEAIRSSLAVLDLAHTSFLVFHWPLKANWNLDGIENGGLSETLCKIVSLENANFLV